MPLATIQLITTLLNIAITYVPTLVGEVKLATDLLESGRDPTPDEVKQIEAALDKATAEVAAAVKARTG